MTTGSPDRELAWIVGLIALVLVLPLIVMTVGMLGVGTMGVGMMGGWDHGMWGSGTVSWWGLLLGFGVQVLVLGAIVAAIYYGVRAVTGRDETGDEALDELRLAYARGDLSDEEFERRRDRLERDL